MTAADDSPIGKIGRVTGRIGPGTTGEIDLAIRGGTSRYNAHPADGTTVVEKGMQVLVTEYSPPLTVYVEPWRTVS